jgi:hypothetical protein
MCEHQIIEDLIDLTPSRSKYVYYCEKCYECFIDIKGNREPVKNNTKSKIIYYPRVFPTIFLIQESNKADRD